MDFITCLFRDKKSKSQKYIFYKVVSILWP